MRRGKRKNGEAGAQREEGQEGARTLWRDESQVTRKFSLSLPNSRKRPFMSFLKLDARDEPLTASMKRVMALLLTPWKPSGSRRAASTSCVLPQASFSSGSFSGCSTPALAK